MLTRSERNTDCPSYQTILWLRPSVLYSSVVSAAAFFASMRGLISSTETCFKPRDRTEIRSTLLIRGNYDAMGWTRISETNKDGETDKERWKEGHVHSSYAP